MEELNNKLHEEILGFDEEKRLDWEKNRKPYSVLFELTARCNLNCIHCYLKDHHYDKDFLSYDEVVEIIDILYDMGILFLTLTGGDVFTRSDFKDIYLYAKKKGFFVEIFTNGELISDELIEIFKVYPPLMIDISIYGSGEEMYKQITGKGEAFDRVMEVCKKLKENKIRFALKTPVLKQTMADLSKMEEIANSFGVPFAYTFELIPTIDGNKEVLSCQLDPEEMLRKEFSDFTKRSEAEKNAVLSVDYKSAIENGMKPPLFICNVAQNSFMVDYKGNVSPCMKMRHKGVPLTRSGYKAIWTEFECYGKMTVSSGYRCTNCKARFQCSSCPGEMDAVYGDYEHIDNTFCKVAYARYAFYNEHKSVEEALKYL